MLLLTSSYLIIREKNKILSLIIFLSAGFIGLSTLNLSLNESLLPMLTGLFGSSSIITSIIKNKKIPKQSLSFKEIKITSKDIFNTAVTTSLASPLCSFLPALGSGQAAVISSDITEERDKKRFLMLLGSINTIIMGLSIISVYSLNITRSGSAVAISKLIESYTLFDLLTIIIVIILSGIFSFFIGCKLAKIFAIKINKINYKGVSLIILLFLFCLVFYFSGFVGIIIFITSTCLGLFTILSGARRTLLMGCLMITSLVLYFPF